MTNICPPILCLTRLVAPWCPKSVAKRKYSPLDTSSSNPFLSLTARMMNYPEETGCRTTTTSWHWARTSKTRPPSRLSSYEECPCVKKVRVLFTLHRFGSSPLRVSRSMNHWLDCRRSSPQVSPRWSPQVRQSGKIPDPLLDGNLVRFSD